MQNPWFIRGVLGAGKSLYSPGMIPLVRARTLSITVRATAGSSVDNDLRCHILYSPDGRNIDTIDYATFDITYTAGSTVQRTANLDIPEHGWLLLKLENLSSADSWSNITVWYTIQSYPPEPGYQRGLVTVDTGEEQQFKEGE